jgi:hypothetical protein
VESAAGVEMREGGRQSRAVQMAVEKRWHVMGPGWPREIWIRVEVHNTKPYDVLLI